MLKKNKGPALVALSPGRTLEPAGSVLRDRSLPADAISQPSGGTTTRTFTAVGRQARAEGGTCSVQHRNTATTVPAAGQTRDMTNNTSQTTTGDSRDNRDNRQMRAEFFNKENRIEKQKSFPYLSTLM